MRAGEQHTGREMLKDLHALGSSFKDFKTRQTVTRGHRKTISGGNMENRAMNEILFKDQEEDEYLKFQNDEELINTKLSEGESAFWFIFSPSGIIPTIDCVFSFLFPHLCACILNSHYRVCSFIPYHQSYG